jgi:hypothetical protein
MALPFTLKKHIKAKEELGKFKYISPCKIYKNPQKKFFKRNQFTLQDIITLVITNLKFQHKPKYHLSKILI